MNAVPQILKWMSQTLCLLGCILLFAAWQPDRLYAQEMTFEADFYQNEGWLGGTSFVRLLDHPQFDLALNALEKGDVAILLLPDKGMFAEVSIESFVARGVRVVVFDENEVVEATFGERAAKGMDRLVSHINGNSELPVVKASVSFPWRAEAWEGQIVLNHPAPLTGVEPVVGSEAHVYVWSPNASVWFVRDASLVTNFMIPMYDNASFLEALTSCEGKCRKVLFTPGRVIARGQPDSPLQTVWDVMDRFRHFVEHQQAAMPYFPWMKLLFGILCFWLLVTAGIAFPTHKDV